ncbi:MAG: RNA polymerase factor sigma-54 [Spirochaetes bacterium]|nr:RNA polymerase factor sigma-54 [Spirochaetota bacterium]
MAMSLNAKLNQSQRLAMTQSMRQSIEMLQLNSIELAEVITAELEKNPVLEEDTSQTESSEAETLKSLEINKSLSGETTEFEKSVEERILFEDSSDTGYSSFLDDDNKKQNFMENAVSGNVTLKEHLLEQLQLLNISPESRTVIEKIITAIDDDGYFRIDRIEFCRENNINLSEFIRAKKTILQFDPAGCAAEDAVECLLYQVYEKFPDDDVLVFILKNHFNELSSYRYEDIASALNLPLDVILDKIRLIKSLSPYPGNRFASGNPVFIIPDLEAEFIDNEIIIFINDEYLPKVKISNYYMKMLKDKNIDKNIRDYVRENINSARSLMKNVSGRNDTLYKIAKSTLERQTEFFKKGPGNLKPLVYADIAEDTGFVESTISRIAVNKYVQTHWGIFPLKYFFVQKAESVSGSEISSDIVLKLISDIVKHENPEKPCSDEDIASRLGNSGISVARRTVAKYRDVLKIPSSAKRKRINTINGGLL